MISNLKNISNLWGSEEKQPVARKKVDLLQFTDIHAEPDHWKRQIGGGFGPLTATFTFINHSPMTKNYGKHFEVTYTKQQLEEACEEIDDLMARLDTEIEELSEAKINLVSKNIEGVREMIATGKLAGVRDLFSGVRDSLKAENWKKYYQYKQQELEVARDVINRALSIPESNFVYQNHLSVA